MVLDMEGGKAFPYHYMHTCAEDICYRCLGLVSWGHKFLVDKMVINHFLRPL